MGNKIKKVLCKNGFGIVWISENVENEGFVLSEIKRKLTDIFLQSWNSKMLEKENLQIQARRNSTQETACIPKNHQSVFPLKPRTFFDPKNGGHLQF